MRYMTEQGRHDDTTPPALPLWRAAEEKRLAEGVGKFDWVASIGIGRRSYDRLALQENRPITRTVKKIADRIGMPYQEAARLAGLTDDEGLDVVINRDGRRIMIQAKTFQKGVVEQQLNILRQVGAEVGRTLGDVLVMTGLASEEELEVADREERVAFKDDDPLFTMEFLSTYRREA